MLQQKWRGRGSPQLETLPRGPRDQRKPRTEMTYMMKWTGGALTQPVQRRTRTRRVRTVTARKGE